jgi:hypothetical protein
MANRDLTDQKMRAHEYFVEFGITDLVHLAKLTDVTRQTLTKWRDEGEWLKQREEVLITPNQIGAKIKRILSAYVSDIEQSQKNGEPVDPGQIDRVLEYSKAIRQIDEQYDEAGTMIEWSKKFIAHCAKLQSETELLKALQRVLPDFYKTLLH